MKFTKKTFYIILFAILYSVVAFSSFWHAVEFFELSNHSWMSVILALAFEIGQATVLLSILTSKKDRGKFTPWLLMCILTLVQIIGNVYSSYKYILQNSPQNLRFFKEPIFIWTDLPDDITTVIVTYVSSAILPLTALLLTSMLTNYLENNDELNDKEQQLKTPESIIEYVPQELTEEEMIAKLKEINPELHISVLDDSDKENENNQQEIEDLKTLLNDKDKETIELKELVESEKKTIDELYIDLDEQEKAITNQVNTINEQVSIIDEQNSIIEDLNNQIEDIKHENEKISSEKDSDIENLNKKLESKEDELKNLNNYVEDLDRTISVKDNALEEINKIIKEKNTEIEDLKYTIEQLRKQKEIIEKPVTEEHKLEEIKEEQPLIEDIEKEKPKRSSHFINLTKKK